MPMLADRNGKPSVSCFSMPEQHKALQGTCVVKHSIDGRLTSAHIGGLFQINFDVPLDGFECFNNRGNYDIYELQAMLDAAGA